MFVEVRGPPLSFWEYDLETVSGETRQALITKLGKLVKAI